MENTETLMIDNDVADVMIKVLIGTTQKTSLTNESITWEKFKNYTEFTVTPTQLTFLYNWFVGCGKEFQKLKW